MSEPPQFNAAELGYDPAIELPSHMQPLTSYLRGQIAQLTNERTHILRTLAVLVKRLQTKDVGVIVTADEILFIENDAKLEINVNAEELQYELRVIERDGDSQPSD